MECLTRRSKHGYYGDDCFPITDGKCGPNCNPSDPPMCTPDDPDCYPGEL